MQPRIISQCLHWLGSPSRSPRHLRLRTKLLFSLVLIIAGLTCATLLTIRQAAEAQVQKEFEKDAQNSVLAFQNLRAERQIELEREAELLATLPSVKAMMADPAAANIQEASEEVWESRGNELFALADWTGKILALHTFTPGFSAKAAQEMLERSQGRRDGRWWFGNGHLYQVALKAIQVGSPSVNRHLGTVVVGREIDSRVARDVGRIAFCQVAFRYGDDLVVSSFSALEERMLATELQSSSAFDPVQIGNERYIVSSIDLTPGSSPPVRLTVLKSNDDAAAFIIGVNHSLIGLGFLAICAGAALAFMISHTFTRPLASLVAGVRALEHADFSYPLETRSGDEVAEVTAAFDRMRRTLRQNEENSKRLEDQLRQAQKMEAVGRLAGGIAHDFNNLLTVIKGHNELIAEKLGTLNPAHNSLSQVKKAADRASSLTHQLLAFSRMQVLQPRVLDLNSLIADVSKMLPMLIGEDIELTFRPGERLARVKADPSQMEQVILNLAVNARDAMPDGGKLTIRTQNVFLDAEYARTHPPTEPGRYVLLVVADTGSGMDVQTKARIFEPFFTTKELGKGTGLGLATVYGVVKQSGGYIWVDSAPREGTRFEIFLPQSAESSEPILQKELSSSVAGTGTVLLVEDEEGVRDLALEFLRTDGYRVLVAKDGSEALEMVERERESIHVLVTDVVMPKMRGTELAQRLKRFLPGLKIVYMSGYLQHESRTPSHEDSAFLQKPFSRETLLRSVREVLGNEAVASPQSIPVPSFR
jgi:signal transduction histidine kinase